PAPGCVQVLAPDEVRLRHTRGLLEALPVTALLAVERDAALADADSRVWRASSGEMLSMRRAVTRLRSGGNLPAERPPARRELPADVVLDPLRRDRPAWLLPALLRPAEKRALDLVADWPWIGEGNLRRLMGVSRSRMRRILAAAERLRLAERIPVDGVARWALTGRGQALLARRDRASVGAARRRWNVRHVPSGDRLDWREVPGSRSRQLLRNIEHTDAVHRFIGATAAQARSLGWEATQLDPPHRASRFFRYGGSLHSVRPDAFGIVRGDGQEAPFFLEWERRAPRPATMAARLAPYLRYYATRRPADDHGTLPLVLVVFDDPLGAAHFLRVARREMSAVGVRVPLWVSDRETLDEAGPLGRAWTAPGLWEGDYAFS
ncbi:MAG: replication-relaxation family protein, partial [Chloroflexota bacterium]|nr:replication-relaxation family protein [Chloroflexota bacterium]